MVKKLLIILLAYVPLSCLQPALVLPGPGYTTGQGDAPDESEETPDEQGDEQEQEKEQEKEDQESPVSPWVGLAILGVGGGLTVVGRELWKRSKK